MYLRRVEVQGFKSFPRKTVLEFEPGLTALVGPNGSGKSNIADAIRWALGEQRSRTLRAQRTEDVIFGGTPKRSRSGMAEVTLVFDNSDGRLPLEYGEINVTRRAYRSGENDYLLNGSAVRFRDLQDLLRTGAMGVNGQVVVGQGQIEAILLLKPEDRRVLLEEAAGVSRHYAKRDEARRRLDQTERNLERLRDLHVELVPRLEELALQAEVAERSGELGEDLNTQTRGLLSHRLWQAVPSLESARLAERDASQKVAELEAVDPRAVDDSAEEAVEAARGRHRDAQAAVEESRTKRAERSADSRLARQQAQFEDRRIAELTARDQETVELITTAQTGIERDQASLEESRSRAIQLETELESDGAELTTVADLQRFQQNAVQARREATKLASEIARLQESDRGLLAREEEAKKDIARGRSGLAEIEQTLRGLEKAVGPAKYEATHAEERAEGAKDARGAAESQVEAARAAVEAAASEVMRCKAEIAGARAEVEALSAVSATSQPDESAVSSLLANADSLQIKGVMRSGIERVPEELAVAFEAAVGHLLDDVLVENAAHVAAVLEFLSGRPASRVRIRPVEGFQSRRRRRFLGGGPPLGPGVHGTLDGMVSMAPAFERTLSRLLESVLVVDTIHTAIDLRTSQSDAADYHIVSLDGGLVDRDGSILPAPVVGESAFDLNERTAAAGERLSEVEKSLAGLLRGEAEARANLASAMNDHEQAIGGLEAATVAVSQARARVHGIEEEISLASRQTNWWQTLVDRSENAGEEIASRRSAAQTRLLELQPLIGPARQAVESADQALSEAHVVPFGSPGARLELERERISNQMEAISRQESEVAVRRKALESTRVDLEDATKRRDAALADADRFDGETAELQLAQSRHEEEVEGLRAAQARLELDRERAALEAGSRELELAKLSSDIETSRDRVESASQRIVELRERALEDLGERDLEPAKLSGSVNDVVSEIERLRHLVEVIGPVNPLAPQQRREESRRLEDLGLQIDDMDNSAAELKKLSRELESAVRDEFMEAFEGIRRSFQKYFVLLMGDGNASMSLTDPEHLATSGIEFDVQIPGKRRQPLNTLSGGETALVAAALLFALIESRGGPLCVLDEVDAALDEENIVRFQNLLDDFAERMQLILITHNGGSIERAGSVFGVAMAADGISQVVSLRLNGVEQQGARREAEAAAQN